LRNLSKFLFEVVRLIVSFTHRSVKRCEGVLLKKSRIFGWKPMWVVLERGVMSVFATRADAATCVNRKSFKYLDDAKVEVSTRDKYSFFVVFSDNTTHIFSVHPPHENGGLVVDGVGTMAVFHGVAGGGLKTEILNLSCGRPVGRLGLAARRALR
jgi:hypothetical protein